MTMYNLSQASRDGTKYPVTVPAYAFPISEVLYAVPVKGLSRRR